MNAILDRHKTHFVLWCPKPTSPPELIIGKIINGNPPDFKRLNSPHPLLFHKAANHAALWELDAATCGLTSGETYHYWIELDDGFHNTTTRIQVTDPLAYGVDYRLYAPVKGSIENPASVIGWLNGKLIACDPNGEKQTPEVVPLGQLPNNDQLVIYELPTAWSRRNGSDEFERAVGTFRDVRALAEAGVLGANFPDLSVTQAGRQYLVELGINALELLPPADSIYSREWGYGTSHYLAPDYELGYPEGNLSPTPIQDLTALVNACHHSGIRMILDVVLGFMKLEPYRNIDFNNFYLEEPKKHTSDPDAYSSRDDGKGGKELRNPFGASCPRYVFTINTYDPISGTDKKISPIRQHMLTFLERWMNDFKIDGIRMDSVENVANWDFIRDFKNAAHAHFSNRYPAAGNSAAEKFLVVGEELTLPKALLSDKRLDGLWNEEFQSFIRAALIGENCKSPFEPSFEWTVRRAIDSTNGIFKDGGLAINHLTSHDVEGNRKERLYNFMQSNITLQESAPLFDRGKIDAEVKQQITLEGGDPSNTIVVKDRTDAKILHLARLRRIKLAFVCLLTSVGVPMILAGEEFADQHDLFDAQGRVTHQGGKQVDPVNYSRVDEVERHDLFDYVSRLIKFRTSHPALSAKETTFIHLDFNEGKRVLVWKRGTNANPVVVVANFSGYTTPNALAAGAEYRVRDWPTTPPGNRWFELTQSRKVTNGQQDKEPIFAWEAKVYHLIADDGT